MTSAIQRQIDSLATIYKLDSALRAVLPYAESRVEDMEESLMTGGCDGCAECTRHHGNHCPHLDKAREALASAVQAVES